jgi:hypothetical protein
VRAAQDEVSAGKAGRGGGVSQLETERSSASAAVASGHHPACTLVTPILEWVLKCAVHTTTWISISFAIICSSRSCCNSLLSVKQKSLTLSDHVTVTVSQWRDLDQKIGCNACTERAHSFFFHCFERHSSRRFISLIHSSARHDDEHKTGQTGQWAGSHWLATDSD